MPYRRLPKTDRARIKALQVALEKNEMSQLIISSSLLSEVRTFLPRFVAAQTYYKQCFENQIKSNKKNQQNVRSARMYISHFIQVLNLCVVRAEIKAEQKDWYGLSRDVNSVPDLSTETALLEWGGKIIKGEKERVRHGGVPIYNPTVARVAVYYDIFKEGHEQQKSLQFLTAKALERLAAMREQADRILFDVWNQVEDHFEMLAGEERLELCRSYGVVYYYRTGEIKHK